MQHILSAKQFEKKDLEEILLKSKQMENACSLGQVKKTLDGKIIACLFFESSTRTRLSFESAALRLGAEVIGMEAGSASSSVKKGESLADTTRIVQNYADAIVVRHPKEGAAEEMANVAKVPIINAGDGGNQHPTQSLLDLYTIKKNLGRLDNLKVAFGFDPKHSRTIKSLAELLTLYENNEFTFVCPPALNPTPEFLGMLTEKKVKYSILNNLSNFGSYDVFYSNRLQEERLEDREEFEKYRKALVIMKSMAEGVKTIILDPLPRVDEIAPEVDDLANAKYFEQAKNGLYVRMALLESVLV